MYTLYFHYPPMLISLNYPNRFTLWSSCFEWFKKIELENLLLIEWSCPWQEHWKYNSDQSYLQGSKLSWSNILIEQLDDCTSSIEAISGHRARFLVKDKSKIVPRFLWYARRLLEVLILNPCFREKASSFPGTICFQFAQKFTLSLRLESRMMNASEYIFRILSFDCVAI